MNKNFQQTVLSELELLLEPLANAATSPDLRDDLLRALGWDTGQIDGFPIDALNTALNDFTAGFQGLSALIDSPPNDLKGLADALFTTEDILLGVIALSHVFDGSGTPTPEGFGDLGKELVDYLTVTYLKRYHPFTFHLLYLLTVIDTITTPGTVNGSGNRVRPAVTRQALRLSQIPALLSDPVGTLKAEYFLTSGITDPTATSDKLFPRLLFFAQQAGAFATYGIDPQFQVDFDFGPLGNQVAARTLTLFRPMPDVGDTGTVGFGTGIALFTDLGVVLRPLGAFQFTETLSGWKLTLSGVVQAEGVAIDSNGVSLPDGAAGGIKLDLLTERLLDTDDSGQLQAFLVGSATGTRLEAGEFSVDLNTNLAPGAYDFGFQINVTDGRFVITSGDGDGFLQHVLPKEIPIDFDLSIGWSKQRGLHFSIGAGLRIRLPVHVSLADVLDIDDIELEIRTDGSSVDLTTTATFTAHLGSVIDAVAQETGLVGHITFPPESGNLGPLNFELGFQLPRGIGIVVHAGPVTGGGFIFLDPQIGRYSGALALSVFGIGVKAFGVVDTIFPDGSKGFSFVIVIVAEFTPIQLGFGFTLLGVGGLIGIDRGLDADALGNAVRTGSLAHLLFPTNPVADAPAIINDLSAVFPPTRGHYVFGPMAKLGWGTPTLIHAELGIVLEFPGPRIAVLGVVNMLLPDPDAAIVALNMAVAGLLDFPAQTFSLDASLYDSQVAGFAVSGDMAFRLGLGSHAKFLLAIGGLNPGFSAPTGFPTLRRAAINLGLNGNPSLVASGYFAITSNTVQVGASIDLRASGFGLSLHGWLGIDALFVFSPFSFSAGLSAGVTVSFHGAKIGITLHGTLSGPSPWHLKGKVCVSIFFWDACLPVDITFGRNHPAALPELNPWVAETEATDPRLKVVRLEEAIVNPRNWSGTAPPAGFTVVVLTEAATEDRTPIDPMGSATLRQKVVPLNRKLEKFGEYKPAVYDHFDLISVKLSNVDLDGDGVPDQVPYQTVQDDFVPAHYSNLSNAQKLSTDSYEKMDAGVSIATDLVRTGDAGSQTLEYETAFITETGDTVRDGPGDQPFKLTQEQLFAMLERTASALGGIRRAGTRRYFLPLDRPKQVTLAAATFVVADACSLDPNSDITPLPTTRSRALLALNAHLQQNPADRGRFTIAPKRAA